MKACQLLVCAFAASTCAFSQVLLDSTEIAPLGLAEPQVVDFAALTGGGPIPNASNINLDLVNQILTINFSWGDANGLKDLKGAFTGASLLSRVTPGAPAQLVYDLTSYVTQQTPTDGGLFNVSLHLQDVGSYTAAQQQQDLLASKFFINVQSSYAPSGEIRSQLTPVPEPHHYALLASAGLIVFAIGRSAVRSTKPL